MLGILEVRITGVSRSDLIAKATDIAVEYFGHDDFHVSTRTPSKYVGEVDLEYLPSLCDAPISEFVQTFVFREGD